MSSVLSEEGRYTSRSQIPYAGARPIPGTPWVAHDSRGVAAHARAANNQRMDEHTPRSSPPFAGLNLRSGAEFFFVRGNVIVSKGMLTRLFQEGHCFKQLFTMSIGVNHEATLPVFALKNLGVSRRAFCALVFALRTGDASAAYKYRLSLESIGGFRFIDRYHRSQAEQKKKRKLRKLHRDTIYSPSSDPEVEGGMR